MIVWVSREFADLEELSQLTRLPISCGEFDNHLLLAYYLAEKMSSFITRTVFRFPFFTSTKSQF